MANTGNYRRSPVKSVLIEDLDEGVWQEEEKRLFSRYGRLYRVRIVGTILKKREIVEEKENERSFLLDSPNENSRVSFLVDDGTGFIWATHWNIDPGFYQPMELGDIIEIIGIIRHFRNRPQINIEIARKIEDANYDTYHLLRVLLRRKTEPQQEIPKIEDMAKMDFDDFEPEEPLDEDLVNHEDIFGNIEDEDLEKETKEFFNQMEDLTESDLLDLDESLSPDEILEGDILENENDLFLDLSKEEDQTISNEATHNNLEEEIYRYISEHDRGDGVSLESLTENFKVPLDVLKKILKNLKDNLKIFRSEPGRYSVLSK